MRVGDAVVSRDTVPRWSFLQYAVFVIALVHVVWAVAGWMAQPSFAIGEHAPTTSVVCMDYNGWHAVGGLVLFGPALFLAVRKSWAAWWCIAAALGGGFGAGIWARFSHRVAWIFTFPHNHMDAVVHVATGVVLLGLVGIQAGLDGGVRAVLADSAVRAR
jgi:hypothetical protein